MDQDWKTQHWHKIYVIHNLAVKLTMWEPCPPEVLPVGAGSEPWQNVASALQSGVCGCWVEVHMCLWVYSAVANSLRSHFGKVGVWDLWF